MDRGTDFVGSRRVFPESFGAVDTSIRDAARVLGRVGGAEIVSTVSVVWEVRSKEWGVQR